MDYSLKGIKTFTGNEGIGLNATIYLGKRKIADVLDDANGGDVQIHYIAREEEAPFVAMVEAWFTASGEEQRWNEEMQKLCAGSDLKPEPARLISKIDQWIDARLADREREKNLKRWAKTKTPYRLKGDTPEEWRIIKSPISPKLIQYLRDKYGGQIETIYGEPAATTPTKP